MSDQKEKTTDWTAWGINTVSSFNDATLDQISKHADTTAKYAVTITSKGHFAVTALTGGVRIANADNKDKKTAEVTGEIIGGIIGVGFATLTAPASVPLAIGAVVVAGGVGSWLGGESGKKTYNFFNSEEKKSPPKQSWI